MSLTNIDHFNHKECEKIDAKCVNAFVDFHIDPDSLTTLCLDTSWGGDCLDLTDLVRAAQTCTSLYLSPAEDPNCLVYEGECETFCITGDELSRIISMQKLKDVDQTTSPTDGDVYMYDGDSNTFKTFNLQQFIDNLDIDLTAVWNAINNLRTRVTNLENAVQPIINHWHLPENLPDDAKIMLGNINLFSDYNATIDNTGIVTSLNRNHGIYGHDLTTDLPYDEIMG